MLNETHYPSKWSVAFVFLVIVLMIAGVFAWAFYFNLGTLIVTSSHPLQMIISGENVECVEKSCEISKVPGVYNVQVFSEGYYDQRFSVELGRFTTLRKEVNFQIVPYLQEYSDNLPKREATEIQLLVNDQTTELVNTLDSTSIASFESLKNPILDTAEMRSVIIDDGRMFVVDMESGRKLRRFGDLINVEAADINDKGTRTVFFAKLDPTLPSMWLWFHDADEMTPQTLLTNPDFFVWVEDSEHEAFLLSKTLVNGEEDSFIEEFLDGVDFSEQALALYRYNFDTASAQFISFFEEERQPKKLHSIAGRYFLEYVDQSIDELIVSE